MTQLSAAKQAEPALAGQYEEEPQTGGRPADRAAAHVVVLVDEWARLHRRGTGPLARTRDHERA